MTDAYVVKTDGDGIADIYLEEEPANKHAELIGGDVEQWEISTHAPNDPGMPYWYIRLTNDGCRPVVDGMRPRLRWDSERRTESATLVKKRQRLFARWAEFKWHGYATTAEEAEQKARAVLDAALNGTADIKVRYEGE